jgi:hypothetical protein
MNRLAFAIDTCLEYGFPVQVTPAAGSRADAYGYVGIREVGRILVCRGMNRSGFDSHFFTGFNNTQGHLSAVGDKNSFKHRLSAAILLF